MTESPQPVSLPPSRPATRRRLRLPVGIAIAASALFLAIGGYNRYNKWNYPYGWSHSCDTYLMVVLGEYAEEHGGEYPAGEATPEASLSLLYPKYFDNNPEYGADILRGKTVPKELVLERLSRGERLT